MKKVLSFAIANSLLLFACMTDSNSPNNPDPGTTGTAKIRFPVVPQAALAKTASFSSNMYFEIDISGPGMNTMSQKWPAFQVSGQTVTLENIPSGPSRTFIGRIWNNGAVTHEGTFSTEVKGGQTAYVPLVLRDVRTGKAEICVEVEGWAMPNCIPIDTLPPDTNYYPRASLTGCWNVYGYSNALVYPAVQINGKMSLVEFEQGVNGTLNNIDGSSYLVNGYKMGSEWRLQLRQTRGTTWIYDVVAKTAAIPVDTFPYPDPMPTEPPITAYVRIDTIGFGPADQGILSGWVTDSSYSQQSLIFKGQSAPCDTAIIDPIPPIVIDTVHPIIIDSIVPQPYIETLSVNSDRRP